MSSPIWLALHCPKCLSLSHQITSSQKIYYHLGQLLRHSSELWGMGSVFNEPATAAFCARFVSWMDSRCSPKMNALYWSSLEVTGFWKATRNRFQTRRTHGKIVSQLRAHIHFYFIFFQCLYNFFLKWDESLKSLFAAMQVSSKGLEWALFSVFKAK